MSKDIDPKRSLPSSVVYIVLILILGLTLLRQYQRNDQSMQVFARQTAEAEYQLSVSLTATQQLENKVKDCGDVFQEYSSTDGFNFNPRCVVGIIYNVEEIEKVDVNEPQGYIAYFSPAPDTFFLYGIYDLRNYVDKCVKVSGEIQYIPPRAPAIYVDEYGENIEVLPNNICQS